MRDTTDRKGSTRWNPLVGAKTIWASVTGIRILSPVLLPAWLERPFPGAFRNTLTRKVHSHPMGWRHRLGSRDLLHPARVTQEIPFGASLA